MSAVVMTACDPLQTIALVRLVGRLMCVSAPNRDLSMLTVVHHFRPQEETQAEAGDGE
jgi:hypothetical protein